MAISAKSTCGPLGYPLSFRIARNSPGIGRKSIDSHVHSHKIRLQPDSNDASFELLTRSEQPTVVLHSPTLDKMLFCRGFCVRSTGSALPWFSSEASFEPGMIERDSRILSVMRSKSPPPEGGAAPLHLQNHKKETI